MKNLPVFNKLHFLQTVLMALFIMLLGKESNAQNTTNNIWGTVFYISSIYHSQNTGKSVADTLTGSAFLISDDEKVYLVTAKHIVQASLLASNQQLLNSNIFISTSINSNDLGLCLEFIPKSDVQHKPYALSSDKEDIAIISLQKKEYKPILNILSNKGYTPIKLNEISTSNELSPGDGVYHRAWFTFKARSGLKTRMQGIFRDTIKTFDIQLLSYKIKALYRQGNDGSPLFNKNNRLIGVITKGEGYLTNSDIIANPYKTSKLADVTRVSLIVSLIKKLQQNELANTFNQ